MTYPSIITIVALGGGTFLLSLLCTTIVRKIALRHNVTDAPDTAPERKIHTKPIPLLGGMAVYAAVLVTLTVYALVSDRFLDGYLRPKMLIGMLIGGLLLMIGGYFDDRHRQSPGRQIIWPILAALAVIASGIGIDYITNPFGEAINLRNVDIVLATFRGTPYRLTLFADLFTLVWLMGMMYTTKFLDGLDGLVSGVTVIGSGILFVLSIRPDVAQPETALLAIVLAGAALGFLVFNFHPARIFLGEGGSLLMGFLLGMIAIVSGGKIATALLVMGIPTLDVAWVIIRRLLKRRSIVAGDNKHLHFRLLDAGLSHRASVLVLYVLTLLFGSAGLLLQGKTKVLALILVGVVTIALAAFVVIRSRRRLSLKPVGVDKGDADGYTAHDNR